MSPGPQSEEKGKGEECCVEGKAGTQTIKLGEAGNGAQSVGCLPGMQEAPG